ncbi:thymidylate kinase [Patellaria atrata CBS 101060]|uniref:Thymidylate kinase n=1 Tax=Patellaria atrata CBS 101060 TaxID=1346257 RepID=A0A9P4SF39_9PEZI|nr:thymidylate kinase [Patellaria atrata CBS 101060]
MRGKLVVFEGLDKAGKSTQCARLIETLQKRGHQVRHQRFPDRTTPIGQMIDSYLRGKNEQEDHVIHLLFSANRWEAATTILKDIKNGTTVVVDRYYYSGCVYSAAKGNPILDLAWARHPEEGLPRPDLCVFLDISAADAAKRGGFGEEKYESKNMQDRVRELFGVLKAAPEKDDFVTIDAGRSMEDVETAILHAVLSRFRDIDDKGTDLGQVAPW